MHVRVEGFEGSKKHPNAVNFTNHERFANADSTVNKSHNIIYVLDTRNVCVHQKYI